MVSYGTFRFIGSKTTQRHLGVFRSVSNGTCNEFPYSTRRTELSAVSILIKSPSLPAKRKTPQRIVNENRSMFEFEYKKLFVNRDCIARRANPLLNC